MKTLYFLPQKIALLAVFLFSTLLFSQTQFTAPGTYTWKVPCGITSITVEAWGGGGAGGGTGTSNGAKRGGGGGGGGYTRSTFIVVPGTSYNIVVGSGGAGNNASNGGNGSSSTFNGTGVIALGGNGGSLSNSATGGAAGTGGAVGSGSGAGTQSYKGGSGSAGNSTRSGSGGGSAGINAAGGDATSSPNGGFGGTAANNGGDGARGRTSNGDGADGFNPGGGGAGALSGNGTTRAGGPGGAGQVNIIYSPFYCVPVINDNNFYINNFSTSNADTDILNNGSGKGITSTGYSNFCDKSVTVKQTASFTINFKGTNNDTFGWAIWVDWNNNKVFDTGEKMYNTTAYTNSGSALINMPANQAVGDYTVRILADYFNTNPNDPCLNGSSGEAEDYVVHVIARPACSGTPVGGTVTVNPVSGAPGSTYDVSASGFTVAAGMTYQWQYNDSGTWINNGSSATEYTALTGLTAPPFGIVRQWRLVIKCTASNMSGISSTGTFTTDYCTSIPTSNDNQGITSVTVGSLTFPVADVMYLNYTGTIPNLYQGTNVNSSITFQTGYSYDANIWIDLNNDGIFSPSEMVYSGASTSASPTVLNTSFPLSSSTTAGQHKMRIGTADTGQVSPNPCYSGTFGVTIDLVVNIIAVIPCSGTPLAGAAVLTPSTGLPSSTFAASITGASADSGLTYQWQIANAAAGPWSDIAGQTGATANLTAVPFQGATRYYRRVTRCTASGLESSSGSAIFTTTSPGYCIATTNNRQSELYIASIAINSTLADPPVNTTTFNTGTNSGYNDYTGLPRAVQTDGSAVNVLATMGGTQPVFNSGGVWRAWVDWNGDGDFDDPGELVYSIDNGYITRDVLFGFIIPAGQTPGDYRLRIRINNSRTNNNMTFGDPTFGPCKNFDNYSGFGVVSGEFGETEDYAFTVKYNCPAKVDTSSINSDPSYGHRCGKGSVTLSASGTGVIKWYTSPSALTPVFTGNLFNTPSINVTTTYYVTSEDSGCETLYRIPVVARIDPAPEVTVTSSAASICGDESSNIVLSTSGDKYEATILDEPFTNSLNLFKNETEGGYNNNALATWQNRPSPYKIESPYIVIGTALSSGFYGGNFASIITSTARNYTILNHLTLLNALDATGFNNGTLKLDFDLYYYSIATDPANGYLKIQYSTDGGTAWVDLPPTYSSNVSLPGKWDRKSIDLPAGAYNANLKIRFSVLSLAVGNETYESIAAVDNVRIYGDKPVTANFSWSGATSVLYDATCTNPLGATASNSICIKPSATQIENDPGWSITATASFGNGCPATKTLVITNNTKTWNPPAALNWSTGNWLPQTSAPGLDKCVIIKKPVNIPATYPAFAKNIKIDTSGSATGSLTISGSLLVNDIINNTGDARKIIVRSEGNLKQIDDSVVNTKPIAVRRLFTWSDANRKEYNYLSSPVYNQNMKEIFGDNAANVPYVTVLNEPTSTFINAKTSDYLVPAKGFSVKEPKSTYGGVPLEGISNKEAEYKGIPNNGEITLPLLYSGISRGYNLAGNPYPSNINIIDLYNNSIVKNPANVAGLSTTFRFWDNVVNQTYVQQGGNYSGYSYAEYNVVSKIGKYADGTDPGYPIPDPNGPSGSGAKLPDSIVKVNQGFLVRATGTGATLNFNNSVRSTARNNIFFGKNSPRNAYHLELITATGLGVQNGIVYMEGGSSSYGKEDSKLQNSSSSDALFSFADNTKIVINGRNLFTTADVIPLGTRHFTNGTYIIRATDLEGAFANGQPIYLKDKQLNILTDIGSGVYTFNSDSGEFTNRFEIVYEPGVVLAADNTTKADIQLYRDQLDFVVQSSAKKIVNIELYDMSGRLMLSRKANSKEVRFNAETLVDGAYVLKAQLQGGEIFTKKLRK